MGVGEGEWGTWKDEDCGSWKDEETEGRHFCSTYCFRNPVRRRNAVPHIFAGLELLQLLRLLHLAQPRRPHPAKSPQTPP